MDKFREWVRAEQGDDQATEDLALMPQARLVEKLPSRESGFGCGIDAMEVGLAAVALGAGRQKKNEAVDHAVGVRFHKKVGD